MFGFKPRPPRTIADVIRQKKRIIFTCTGCKTITSKDPTGIFYKPNMELRSVESFTACPECGASNLAGFAKRLILTVVD